MADDREQLHKLALDEAERAVTQQQAVLEQVRTRAVGLIAVGSGVAAFVGVRAEQLRTAGWVSLAGGLLGLAAYTASVALAGLVLMPQEHWVFSNDATTMIRSADRKPDDEMMGEYSRYLRDMALFTDQSVRTNGDKLQRLTNLYAVGVWLLGVQVVSWLLAAARF